MKRLLAYLKPHKAAMVLVTVLVVFITALELYKPIIIGDAIDDYIEGYNIPYEEVPEKTEGAVSYNGKWLVRTDKDVHTDKKADTDEKEGVNGPVSPHGAVATGGFYQLFLYNDCYYMLDDVDRTVSAAVQEADGEALAEFAKEARLLSKEELRELRKTDFTGICLAAAVYLLVLLFVFVFNVIQTYVLQRMGQDIIYRMREEVFGHIHSLSLNFFNTTPVGKLVTRVANDTEAVNEMFTNVLVKLFKNTIKILGFAVVMFSINAKLTVYAFLMLPVVTVLTFVFRYLSRQAYRVTRNRITEINTFLSENISGMKLIQIFTREKEKYDEFEHKSLGLFKAGFKEVLIFAVFRPTIYMLSVVALVIIIGNGSFLVLENGISLGVLFIFINYIGSFFEPIQELAEQFGTLQSSLASAEKVFQILDEEPEVKNPENPKEVNIRGKIEFKHVWFAYEKEDYILKDVSFTIEPGEKAAFVGATGAGKSSILNLIGRYFDIQKGEILIDGVDIREIDTDVLRRAIGQVQQDVFLFTGDIKGNISLRDETLTMEEIKAAAEYVEADSFIKKLPDGYDEPVTERGATLSAGQRQLLAFARTLAYNPFILVLDEATANIDTETESLITGALEKLMNGRTTIMVAHRLSTIQHADKIMVMHKGRIVECGSHRELLQKEGMYRKLYELQLAAR